MVSGSLRSGNTELTAGTAVLHIGKDQNSKYHNIVFLFLLDLAKSITGNADEDLTGTGT